MGVAHSYCLDTEYDICTVVQMIQQEDKAWQD